MSNLKAIFITGPSGAGKSFIAQLLPVSDFEIINIDDVYEVLLKDSGIGTKQKDFDPEKLSMAAKMMAQAHAITGEKLENSVKDKKSILIDGTGAAYRPVLAKKELLDGSGYDTMMVMVYASPITALERNDNRERSLIPSIILKTWRDVNKNLDIYSEYFGKNFIVINNDPESANKEFDESYIKSKFLDLAKAKGKPKTEKEKAKSDEEKMKISQDIKIYLKRPINFTELRSALKTVESFISK
jgi:dephospho-CoA kinase